MISHILLLNSTDMIMNLWFRFANPSFEELFCENTDKPEMECHGCCKIKKINLAPEEQKDFSVPSLMPNHELSVYLISSRLQGISTTLRLYTHISQIYLFSYTSSIVRNCFHPPEIRQIKFYWI